MSALNQQQRHTQAVKVILSQLYVTWATSDAGSLDIQRAIGDIMTVAQRSVAGGGVLSEKSPTDIRHLSEVPQMKMHGDSNEQFLDHNGVASQNSPHQTNSPPPSSPSVLSRHTSDDLTRTPSPAQTGRFFGVDELDFSHRGGSPNGSCPSPSGLNQSRPVVDPMAPVPHSNNSGSVIGGGASSPTAHYSGALSNDLALTVAVAPGDNFSPLDTSVSGNAPSSQRVVHLSGSFASKPPPNVERASSSDVPAFYDSNARKGGRNSLNEEEEQALRRFFSFKLPLANRKPSASPISSIDPTKTVRKGQFGKLCKQVFNVPTWLKEALFRRITAASGVPETGALTYEQLSNFYYNVFGPLSRNRRLFELLRGDSRTEYLNLQCFKHAVRYLVDTHVSLEFLKQPEFKGYYCHTVAIRIMYSLERQQSGRISWYDFDRSDLPEVMIEVDDKDVNLVHQYFSYEHFYVLYCKFWELDTDRDQLIGFDDLCKYGQGSVCTSVIKRVVEGAGRALSSGEPGKLDFEDFVYFCLSEEDKNSRSAVYYWFKVLDLDGDGVLSGYELYEFFQENQQRFLEYFDYGDVELSYSDMMCQMKDMLGFSRVEDEKFGLTIADLRACATPANFFNMVFNAAKFMLFEHRDPFADHQLKLRPEKTEWARFARAEYDRLAHETI
ncbi:EF hand domain [Trypanosoma vivax]|uniref:EF-hand domain-containing protein n=1 Tax=Trypanosoma vivax (strain Y486) TaxID=1055687 RepID=G0U3B1_TRYVY|nr:hypothetical protein TRVL_00914 [Trypanosoma vivax]KAH8604242.1 EF hand domain [Trypanosoma vivax]CCC50767.1 conserved hypothetical protein [Trypanosoma vivax Y486]